MNTIYTIIQVLTPEEKLEFIGLLRKKNKRNDTKNISLFKLLDTNSKSKNPDILIYGKPSKGAYHALCKRLHDSLIDYVASKSFKNEANEEMEALKLLVASRTFFEHKYYNLGFKTIDKAERSAKKFELYSILNEIYYTKIQFASQNPNIVLEDLITLLTTNKNLLKQEENFMLFYATVTNEIKNSSKNLIPILEANFSRFNISISENLSFKAFFTLLEIITNTANINRDYDAALSFIEKMYLLLNKEKRLIEKQLFYHIQIIYYVANSHFRNRDFKTSQQYLNKMQQLMALQKRKYFERFLPQYCLLQSLLFNFTGSATKAIELIENSDFTKYKTQISYILDLQLSLIVFHFQQSDYKKSLKLLHSLSHSDNWYTQKASNLWVIQKCLIELLIYIELEYDDLLESRLKSFSKKHLPYLKEKKEIEVLSFFKILSQTHVHKDYMASEKFNNEIELLKAPSNLKNKDIFYLSFYAWLLAKSKNKNLYDCTLQLLK